MLENGAVLIERMKNVEIIGALLYTRYSMLVLGIHGQWCFVSPKVTTSNEIINLIMKRITVL